MPVCKKISTVVFVILYTQKKKGSPGKKKIPYLISSEYCHLIDFTVGTNPIPDTKQCNY